MHTTTHIDGALAPRSTRRKLLARASVGVLSAAAVLVLAAPSALASGGHSGGGGSAPAPTGNPVLQSLSFAPTSVTGGSASTGAIRFGSVTDGAVVHLTSSNPAALQVPASTVVSGGQSTGTFAITTSPVTDSTPLTITATSFGVTVTGTLSVTPGVPAAADVVKITRAEWVLGMFRIEATSTNPKAILGVYGPATGVLMFMLNNDGGRRYSIQHPWLDNTGGVVVKSNFGGSDSASTLR